MTRRLFLLENCFTECKGDEVEDNVTYVIFKNADKHDKTYRCVSPIVEFSSEIKIFWKVYFKILWSESCLRMPFTSKAYNVFIVVNRSESLLTWIRS